MFLLIEKLIINTMVWYDAVEAISLSNQLFLIMQKIKIIFFKF
mgnify:CR=1 FL=1